MKWSYFPRQLRSLQGVLIGIVVLCAISAPSQTTRTTPAFPRQVWTRDATPLRAGPRAASREVTQPLRTATALSVHGAEGQWYFVSTPQGTGWIEAQHVSSNPPNVQQLSQREQELVERRQQQEAQAAVTPQPVPSTPSVSPSPQAQHRRALVIGNAAYPDSPLANPVNDATDLATVLRRLGFETTLRKNADKPTMDQAIEDFTRGVPRGSVGLFFFSGHGIQIGGVNYLVPLGARFSAPSDVKYHAVAADWILERMDDSGMDVKLLILDACRNNPLGRSWTRSTSRGLAVMETPKGALIAYATSPGKTASDGTGRNSPFTARLLREVTVPGRPIELVFKAVRVGVQQETNGQQIPWEASSLIGEFVFAR